MQRYESYKPSGADWLGDIPAHWSVTPAKRLFREISEKNHPDAELLSVTQELGVVPRSKLEQRVVMPTGQLKTFKLVRSGDFVISLRSFQGGIEHSNYTGLVSPAYTVLRMQREANPNYLKHLLKSAPFISELNTAVTGIREGKNISFSEMAYSLLPLPPLEEQDRIVAFLDQKATEIDSAITKKERLIELLQEQKKISFDNILYGQYKETSVIEGARGQFFPKLGNGIDLIQLGRVCKKIADGPHFSPPYVDAKQGYLFLSAGNIRPDKFLLHDLKYVSDRHFFEFCKRVRPEFGDVLYTKGGTTGVAKNVDINTPFQVWVHIAVLKLRRELVEPRYLAYALNSSGCYAQSQLFTRGATNKDLGLTRMKNIYLPICPLNQQEAVVKSLDQLNDQFNKTEENIRGEISLLTDLKIILIAYAVTGRIKI